MNPQVPDELLSAYFDGEASPEERAVVEKLLDGSVTSRRELNEISQLSALLHSFPREAAPVELASRVRQQTDQIPLAAPGSTGAASVAAIAPARSLRREWLAACLGAAATAAALLLMVNLVDRPVSRALAIRESDSATKLALGATIAGTQNSRLSEPRLSDRERESVVGEALRRDLTRFDDGTRAPDNFTVSGDGAAAAGTVSQPTPSAAAMTRRSGAAADEVRVEQQHVFGINGVVTDNSATPLNVNNSDFLNGLRVGEVYQFVPQVADPENNVAVVELAVLDIERGADQVQVLLSRNSIRPRQSGQAGPAGQVGGLPKLPSGKLREPANANDIVVVYSVGPGEQLAKALEDMARQPELFLSWTTQPPVQLPVVESLAESKADGIAVKDSAAPTIKSKLDPQSVSRDKASTADNGLDEEAAQALNALLARGTDSNHGFGNWSDSTAKNGRQGSPVEGQKTDGKALEGVVDQRTPQSAPAVAKQFSENGRKSAVRGTDPAPTVADAARQRAKLKQSGGGLDAAGAGRSYQQRINVQADRPAPVELLPSNNLSQGMNSRGGANSSRRGSNSFLPQLNDSGRSEGVRHAVKVLFVLHSPQVPAAPAAMPAGKPIR